MKLREFFEMQRVTTKGMVAFARCIKLPNKESKYNIVVPIQEGHSIMLSTNMELQGNEIFALDSIEFDEATKTWKGEIIGNYDSCILVVADSKGRQTLIAESTWQEVYNRFETYYQGYYIMYKINGNILE